MNIGAIILAAGLGKRIRKVSQGKPKFLVTLKSMPLITYPLRILKKVGVKEIVIVVPGGWMEETLGIVQELGLYNTTIIENNRFWRENGYSLYLGLKHSSRENDVIVLSMVDHLYTRELVLKIINTLLVGNDIMVVGGDSRALFVDIEEATKIAVRDNDVIVDIGKHLKEYDYIDVGVMATKPDMINYIGKLVETEEILSLNKIIRKLSSSGKIRVADVTGLYWTEIDTDDDYYEVISGRKKIVLYKVLEELGGR